MELSYAIARYEQAAELLPIRWQQAARRCWVSAAAIRCWGSRSVIRKAWKMAAV